MSIKNDLNKAGFEQSEFPILCETCLGPNPYVRMSKQDLGAECKICTRPFTIFRWQPGQGARHKKTEICQTCARVKNVCQTCLLDLQYNLPTQIRDAALKRDKVAPTSAVNREYFAQNLEGDLDSVHSEISFDKLDGDGKELLRKLARADPYYNRNRPKICSFFVKGECNRGDACPYRHEMPKQTALSQQNIQDRYHGRNDPVARKIMAGHAAEKGLAPPEDTSITSLFVSGLPDGVTEPVVRGSLPESVPAASLRGVVLVPASHCAFLNFVDRAAAEEACIQLGLRWSVNGKDCKVQWGRSKRKPGAATPATSGEASGSNATLLPAAA